MDMNNFVPHWINNTELQRLGGAYHGVVARVVEEVVHDRYKGVKKPQPVIEFEDGYRVVPNITMRRMLMERFGPDTDLWIGARLAITCRSVLRTDATGGTREAWTKHLLIEGYPSEAEPVPAWVTEPDEFDAARETYGGVESDGDGGDAD